MDDFLQIILAIVVVIFVLIIGSCHKIADYNFCSEHFPEETWSCMFSDKYKYDGDK